MSIRDLAMLATAEPDAEDGATFTCRRCRADCYTRDEAEPSPLCDNCAQEIAATLGAYVLALPVIDSPPER